LALQKGRKKGGTNLSEKKHRERGTAGYGRKGRETPRRSIAGRRKRTVGNGGGGIEG